MRYKVLQFWFNLKTNHSFTFKGNSFEKFTDVNFVYFMCAITILHCLKEIIKVDPKIENCIIFGQTGLVYFFEGEIGYGYFYQSIVPHHTKIIKLKKVITDNHEI